MQFPVSKSNRTPAIKPLLLASLLATCFATPAIAQEADNMEEKTLEPVVVTASRVEQLQKEAIPSTTVITSETIQNKKLADIPSILRSEAGVELARNGGAGQPVSVFMRGTNSNQVLVLLDGVPIRSESEVGTTQLLSHIQPEQIDHIEVVRGNVSSIYGSGAMGGVVQIFTKQGTGKPTANVFAEYGSHNTTKIGAGVSGRTDGGTSFAFSATRYRTDGIKAVNPEKLSYGDWDKDYDRNVSMNAAISQKLNKDHELGMRLYMYDTKTDYDDSPFQNDWIKSKQWTGAIYSKNRLTQDWLSTVTVSHSDTKRKYINEGSGYINKSNYQSETNLLQWDNQIALSSAWTLTAGVDAGTDKIKTNVYWSSPYSASRDKYSVYAGVLGNVGNHSLQANVRYDHVEDADSDTTGFLGYGYNLNSNWKLLANASTSFIAPNMYQLYDVMSGTRNLKSEQSTNYEAGIQYAKDKDLVRLTVFQWHTRNLIDYYNSNGRYAFYNIDRAKNIGVELNARTQILGLDLNTNLTWQNPKNRETGERLLRRARFFGSLDISKTIGSWYLGGDIQYMSSRDDQYTDWGSYDTKLGSYTLINLNARYNINKNVSVYARLENLLNKDYETVYGYEQPGRGAYVGVNFKM